MKTVFLRMLEAEDKAVALLAAIREYKASGGGCRFDVEAESFRGVPRSPFAYWVSDAFRAIFETLEPFGSEGRITRQGLATAGDFRWVRTWWERSLGAGDDAFPVPYAKGGAFSPFYADLPLAIRWGYDGRWIKVWKAEQFRLGVFTANNSKCWNENLYFRPGLTWPLRSQRGLSLRPMPSGVIFGQKGSAAFVPDNNSNQLLSYLAIFNSAPSLALVQMQMAFGAYDVGVIARTPVPFVRDAELNDLAALARRAWTLKRDIDKSNEVSHAYTLPALLRVAGDTLLARTANWHERLRIFGAELATIQSEIDAQCFDLYGIDDDDKRSITEISGGGILSTNSVDGPDDADDSDDTDDSGNENDAYVDQATLAVELVSWTVGVVFGRFDVRASTDALTAPDDPNPFDPLPICSPAMLAGDDGLPVINPPAGYPLPFPETGILVDDPGHARDLTSRVHAVFVEVFKSNLTTWWTEVGALLNPKTNELRAWLASSFFEHHLRRYSRSRRKAPIFWQLSVPSVRYSIWLYSLRLTHDSLFQVQNEVVAPKLAYEERQLTSFTANAGSNPSAKDRKEIAEREAFVGELRSFLEEIKRVAPLWYPMVDDGLLVTMAPLWRLVPHHRTWQRELKSKWDELAAGKLDWSHIALHLWPERVIPKCGIDRSLAIAHGLENIFWVESLDSKWRPRPVPTRSIDELVRERTSVAVKAALKELTEAAGPVGPKVRARRSS